MISTRAAVRNMEKKKVDTSLNRKLRVTNSLSNGNLGVQTVRLRGASQVLVKGVATKERTQRCTRLLINILITALTTIITTKIITIIALSMTFNFCFLCVTTFCPVIDSKLLYVS